jgi:hypothetical protein
MKIIILFIGLLIGLCCCRGPHSHPDAYNPYLHAKHKPSEDIRKEFVKQDRWFRRRKNKIFFERKN